MSTLRLRVTLQSDTIFTSSGATIGKPESLDRLPGAALLGAAAARCYRELGEASLEVFHLGSVRFGDGLPIHPTLGLAVPTPLSWHGTKYGVRRCLDFSQAERSEREQYSQMRDGWRLQVPDLGWVRWSPGRVSTMRTAISEEGRAREGLLYGFEAVPAGTCYQVDLQGDDEALLQKIVATLMREPIFLGRSRHAEFGEALVVQDDAMEGPPLAGELPQPGRVRFLCVSDLALVDEATGVPRLRPCTRDFQIPGGWALDESSSFLRFRRYSPFNAWRRRPDLERQVIEAGSVITFVDKQGEADVVLSRLRAHAAAGIGQYQVAGLGAVLVEPSVLMAPQPVLPDPRDERVIGALRAPDVAAPAPADPLVGWLRARAEEDLRLDATWKAAEEQAKKAASWRIPRSQWGRLRAIAAEARHGGTGARSLRAELVQHMTHGVRGDTWKRRGEQLLRWFEGLAGSPDVDPLRALELLGRRVPRHMADQEGGDDDY